VGHGRNVRSGSERHKAVRAHELHAIPERGDRRIAATALELGYPLVTRDAEIAAVIGTEQLW